MIKGTPFWVWLVLLYLLFIGVRSLNTRIVYLPKLFIIPLVLLLIKYKIFLSQYSVVLILAIVFGSVLNFIMHTNSKVEIIKNSKSVKLPGSYSTLLILIFFFVVKYFLGYLSATDPDLAIKYSLFEIIISGLLSGYFLGRAIYYIYKYLKD